MDKYDYKDEADKVGFSLVPVVENWDALRSGLKSSDAISSSEKSQILAIVNGGGSFVDKESNTSKLSSYKMLMKEIYPDLRNARTEVVTVIEKKPNNEILRALLKPSQFSTTGTKSNPIDSASSL
jgi:isopentenyl phosphate kinase